MRKHYGLFAFAIGLLLLVVQFLTFVFRFLNSGDFDTGVVFVSGTEDTSFMTFISEFWAGLAGCLLLIVLFVRRMSKGPEPMLTLVGVLLWIIQILSLYESQNVGSFVLEYFLGVVGIVLTGIAGFNDAYLMKSKNPDDTDNDK